jgi:hypothetical protein
MPSAASILIASGSALAITLLFYVPGVAWAWTLRPASRLEAAAFALVIGPVAILLTAVGLAEWGGLNRAAVWWAAAVLAIGGDLARRRVAAPFPRAGAGALLLVTALTLVLAWSGRGGWILGGWDPGVNMNQGLLVARTGHVAQPPDPLVAEALRAAPDAFARASFGFVEVSPGLPVDRETGALRPYFYRGTPTFIAVLDLMAGRAAALSAHGVAALMALLVAAALLSRIVATAAPGIRRTAALTGTLILAGQPIVLAHLGTPASELLELLLVCGIGLLLLRPRDRMSAMALALVLFLACINRVSFLFHQALLLLVLACWDASETDRDAVAFRHLAVGASLALGFAWYAWITPESLVKVRHLVPALHVLAAGSVATALLVDGGFRRRPGPAWLRPAAMLVPLLLLLVEATRHEPWREVLRNAPAWWAYAGPALAVLAGLGLLAGAARSPSAPWLVWLFTCLLAVLLRRHAADLYPWAAKRWLAFSPPLLAAGGALLLAASHRRFGRRGFTVALVLLFAAIGWQAPRGLAAGRAEYRGAPDALQDIAARVEPGDVVVADHFRWGTPLALAHGKPVLNAEPLLAGRGSAADAARFLAGQHARGRRVVLLTSTRGALAWWPEAFRNARPMGPPLEFETEERIQHRSNRGFPMQVRTVRLQTWTWTPPP